MEYTKSLRISDACGKVEVACPQCKWESRILSEQIRRGEVIICPICRHRFYFLPDKCLSRRDQERAKQLVSQWVARTPFNRLRIENIRLKVEV